VTTDVGATPGLVPLELMRAHAATAAAAAAAAAHGSAPAGRPRVMFADDAGPSAPSCTQGAPGSAPTASTGGPRTSTTSAAAALPEGRTSPPSSPQPLVLSPGKTLKRVRLAMPGSPAQSPLAGPAASSPGAAGAVIGKPQAFDAAQLAVGTGAAVVASSGAVSELAVVAPELAVIEADSAPGPHSEPQGTAAEASPTAGDAAAEPAGVAAGPGTTAETAEGVLMEALQAAEANGVGHVPVDCQVHANGSSELGPLARSLCPAGPHELNEGVQEQRQQQHAPLPAAAAAAAAAGFGDMVQGEALLDGVQCHANQQGHESCVEQESRKGRKRVRFDGDE